MTKHLAEILAHHLKRIGKLDADAINELEDALNDAVEHTDGLAQSVETLEGKVEAIDNATGGAGWRSQR